MSDAHGRMPPPACFCCCMYIWYRETSDLSLSTSSCPGYNACITHYKSQASRCSQRWVQLCLV